MADQRTMTVDELNNLLVSPEKQAANQDQSKSAPMPTQGGMSVDELNRMTSGKAKPEIGFGEDVLRSAGAGLSRGAVGLTGLPGDIEALGRYGAKAAGYNVGQETVLPTSEEMIKKAEKYIPGASEIMSHKPVYAPSRYVKTAAEFIPGAFGGPGTIGAKVAGSIGAGAGVQAVEDYMKGTKYEGTPYEIVGKLAAAVPGYGVGTRALSALKAPTSGLLTPEAEAAKRLALSLEKDMTVGGKYGAKLTPEEMAAAGAETTLGAIGGQRTRQLIEKSAARAPEEAQGMYISRTGQMASEAPANMARHIDDMFGGTAVNPLDEMDRILRESRRVTGPEYQRVMGLPNAQSIINNDLIDVVNRLPRGAVNEIADRLRLEGIDAASLGMTKTGGQWNINPNGMPLQFWDATKRYLDTSIAKLKDPVSGKISDTTLNNAYNNTLAKLKTSLDTAVPEYGAVRGAAAEAFGANNAMDLGMKYLSETNPRNLRNYENIYRNLSPAHKEEFAYGLAGAYKQMFAQNPDKGFKLFSGPTGQANAQKMRFGLQSIGPDAADSLVNYSKIQAANKTINAIKPVEESFMRSNLIPGLTGAGAFVSDVLFQPFLWSGNPGAFASAVVGYAGGKYYTWKEARIAAKVMELASDPAKVNELRRLIKADPNANSFLGKTQALIKENAKYPAGAFTSTETREQGQNQGGRIERASGGRISHEIEANRLVRMADVAKKQIGSGTEQILNAPDELVVKALKVANQKLEG